MVSGFVLADIAIQQPLTDFIWSADIRNEDCIETLAKMFFALRTSFEMLASYYRQLQTSEKLDFRAKFPFFKSFTRPNGEVVEIEYISRVTDLEPDPSRAIYYARHRTRTQEHMVVKFVKKYSEEAHACLAERYLAPQLHYYGRIPGGQYVIIMDRAVGLNASDDLQIRSRGLSLSAFKNISEAIDILHKHGFVFGDLRLPNIIILDTPITFPATDSSTSETRTDPVEAILVDFDWSGREGDDTRYPNSINMAQIDWPPGVGPGTKITAAHDQRMLQEIRRACSIRPED
jgi:hypothetical protein